MSMGALQAHNNRRGCKLQLTRPIFKYIQLLRMPVVVNTEAMDGDEGELQQRDKTLSTSNHEVVFLYPPVGGQRFALGKGLFLDPKNKFRDIFVSLTISGCGSHSGAGSFDRRGLCSLRCRALSKDVTAMSLLEFSNLSTLREHLEGPEAARWCKPAASHWRHTALAPRWIGAICFREQEAVIFRYLHHSIPYMLAIAPFHAPSLDRYFDKTFLKKFLEARDRCLGSCSSMVWTHTQNSKSIPWSINGGAEMGEWNFSSGAGGFFLRERFGYEARKSRSWRLLTQYSLTSTSQAEMFARIREATDHTNESYGLGEDWSTSMIRIL
ncbi:hypothetical protein AURANDRAFT_67998 [Aureococcus anophagefferens]|uniref:Uncharacterized protein n=1 Tax=Aureococcus anophagefferens TaxID=44056 RepID=F0YN64_AURAN|nr:hypothetical protein AURANDRAFT_67998 [Aureococcus anophagefferens]EGB03458.1 hypothetical protein AURANDRAFT_67998 [Aureococcus anophagefferens]|eukprot:XP_009041857.1 hypothetical protein AURANDRAFT_67998 [Aureococcus anophagefferens]